MTSRKITFPDGRTVSPLGIGTWRMGENPSHALRETDAIKLGLDCGADLVDTAEMYGEGGAEEIVAEAIKGRRDEVYLVSKLYPHNASTSGVISACERSLRRLNTDRIDLYLLHWRGSIGFSETIEGFERLIDDGKIRSFGVSNFDTDDLVEWTNTPGGNQLHTNQILYNLNRRWSEWSLQSWCRDRNIPVMAYTPLEPVMGRTNATIENIARSHNASPAQIALSWVLSRPNVMTIPKASSAAHVKDNAAALEISLTPEDLVALDGEFPAPSQPARLELN